MPAGLLLPAELEALDLHLLERVLALDDAVDAVELRADQRLPRVGARPADVDLLHGGRVAEPDLLLERRRAEAATGAADEVHRAVARRRRDVDADARADRAAVRLHALQPQRDPV